MPSRNNAVASGEVTFSGSVAGRRLVNITANNLQNLGGRITTCAVSVNAARNLNVTTEKTTNVAKKKPEDPLAVV